MRLAFWPFTLKFNGFASVVPKKKEPSVIPVLPVVDHPPAAPIVDQLASVPLVVRNFPALPVCEGAKAVNAADAELAPVPPNAIGIAVPFQVPVVIVPKVLMEACPV